MAVIIRNKSSFRDPSGYVFSYKGKIYRSVGYNARADYDYFTKSGLYRKLTKLNFLIPHKEVRDFNTKKNYKVLYPEEIPFISYPYEWSFSQLKEAALLTLTIQKIALNFGMSLKDASSYNIQFLNGAPIFIDTLSFEKYNAGMPWVSYRQFCEHFLGPISLMSHTDLRLSKLLASFIDGIPLDLTRSLLPRSAFINPTLLFHIYLHSKIKNVLPQKVVNNEKNIRVSLGNQKLILDNIENYIKKALPKKSRGDWGYYYQKLGYSKSSFEHKKKIVSGFVKLLKPTTVWDVGANDGLFSRLIYKDAKHIISSDSDPEVVDKNYLHNKISKIKNILPLVVDLVDPSPGIGWQNAERSPFLERAKFDCVLALALTHHLVVKNNISFDMQGRLFSGVAKHLIVEFVGESDERFKDIILKTKNKVLDYSQKSFEDAFLSYFKLVKKSRIEGSDRLIYLFKRKQN